MAVAARRKRLTIVLSALFIGAWIVLVFLAPPAEIVERVGVENAYLVVLLLSIIGALGSITTFSSYPAIVTFAAGDMNVLALGLVSGIGLTLGDAVFYFLCTEIKGLLTGRLEEKAVATGLWLETQPAWVIPLVTYVWVGLLPLANNLLTGALAITGYPFRRILPPLFLGNVTFPTGVAYFASLGFTFFA